MVIHMGMIIHMAVVMAVLALGATVISIATVMVVLTATEMCALSVAAAKYFLTDSGLVAMCGRNGYLLAMFT